jgi:predicted amidohydrolase
MRRARPLRVAALELPARFGEPEAAFAEVETLLAGGPPTDLVLLPEASFTGYVSPDLERGPDCFAEPLGGPTTARLAALARAHAVHLVAPLILRERGCVYNAMLALRPDGSLAATYRKRHPWYLERWATAGEEANALFDVEGTRVAVAICFDVHFLAEESAEVLRAADLLLFPSAWVEEDDSRPVLLGELARTFGLAILNANWGRGTPRIAGQGGSLVVGPTGEPLARAPERAGPHRVDAVLSPTR